ncbi:MAG: TatD family hydrolase [Bacilli bacterium]|nr:TatD family hydrolase [Bacilli bacterium]
MYIDTHCHMSRNDYNDIPFLIDKIRKSGVNKIIVNGCSIESSKEVLELTKKYDIVYGAIGFHPTELDTFKESDLEWLEEHINDDKIVALGEIGLDYHYDNTDKNKQNYAFKKQLEIAKKYNKPIIVHSRDAIQDTYNILKEYNLKGSLHCFGSSLEMAREFIKLGYLIGVGGVVTFKNAKNIVNVIKNIDLEYILLETDSPYLTPEPYRGEQNDSSYIPLIANKIAEIKEIDVEVVEKTTTANASGIFDF